MSHRAWPHILLTVTLAFANAVVFPLWTGYAGGAVPLPPGIGGLLPYLIIAVVNVGSLLLLRAISVDRGIQARWVVVLVAFTRIAYLVARAAQGANVADQDVEIFFNYGRELVAGRYPAMEYPQGALLLFASAYMLAAGELSHFRTILPLLTLPFDLIIVGSLLWLGKYYSADRASSALGLLYAISPFTLVLWYGKYDAVPAALLALGASLFVAGWLSISALILAIGFLMKWFPGIAIVFFVAWLLRSGKFQSAFRFTLIAAVAILFPLTIFWLIAPDKVIYTYAFQNARPVMGESLLYIPAFLLEPSARLASSIPPWEDINSKLFSNNVAILILLTGEGIILTGLTVKRVRQETAVALTGLGVAMFIITNRVFSPQYMLVLFVAYALGFISLSPNHRVASVADLALFVLTFLNYLIWPLWADYWLGASALFFGLNLVLMIWLAYSCTRLGRVQETPLQTT